MLMPSAKTLPALIQGGMGVAVSSWPLARAVAANGQLGVVSGTAADVVLARRLQDGDAGGDAAQAHAAQSTCIFSRDATDAGGLLRIPHGRVSVLLVRL